MFKMGFKLKCGRFNSRIVELGYKQQYGYNYDKTYSPIIQYISLKMILLMSLKRKCKLIKAIVKTSFCNTNIDEDVYINLPEGIEQVGVDKDGNIGKLNASLYILKNLQ